MQRRKVTYPPVKHTRIQRITFGALSLIINRWRKDLRFLDVSRQCDTRRAHACVRHLAGDMKIGQRIIQMSEFIGIVF